MAEFILLLQAFATLAMVGLIWFVQVVHYPLFDAVGRERFAVYEVAHQNRTTLVVAPLMAVEALAAFLMIWFRPESVPAGAPIAGLMLLAMIWLSTYFWQVPAHASLASSYSKRMHRRLVRSNWVRTAAWTARGLLVCWMIAETCLRVPQ